MRDCVMSVLAELCQERVSVVEDLSMQHSWLTVERLRKRTAAPLQLISHPMSKKLQVALSGGALHLPSPDFQLRLHIPP